MISEKERLLETLNGNTVDRPPVICPGGMMNMITEELMENINVYMPKAHFDSRLMADLAKAVYSEGCFENFGVPFCMTVEAENMGAEVDMGSTIFEPHVIDYLIYTVLDWRKLPQFDLNKGRMKVVLDAIKLIKEETENIPIVGNLTGPISTASSIMEPLNFYKELRKKNSEAHEYMNFITRELIKFAKAQIEAGADLITISDPSGTGEILGPKLFEEFVVKYINDLVLEISSLNVPVIVHICGQMDKVYNEVNKIKANALSFDSIVSVKGSRKHLEDRIIMGNISTYALEFSDPEKIKNNTKYCREHGMNIISPACGLGMRSPLKNIKSILKTIKEEE